ncbi:unnamed protein product [Wuchereria bancrofti]|uniref:Prokaryotic-type class I peptide chain release factors domain-containing protein n=1 Tax=Wuchereria bancrofti TaxID=6293 RepID=A0A3P7DUB2_WUCBA|nr:unnamed protein product [Wuchereria bancrofti]
MYLMVFRLINCGKISLYGMKNLTVIFIICDDLLSVNTKCQIRFNLNEADWLSPEIKEVFRKRFVRLLSKQNDVVISSDKSRIQEENQEDCFEKLQAMLTECNKELLDNRLPTDQDKAIIDNRAIRAAQRRLYAKRMQSQKKKNRDPYESL